MHRRGFLGAGVAGSVFSASGAAASQAPRLWGAEQGPPFLERKQSGKPHQGKMLAVIQPHNDDVPLFAAGTVLKLIDEGYEGILIRATNDDHAGA